MDDLTPPQTQEAPGEYRVLARKYRPQTLDDLKGQDALVRTLRNALASGRLAHAFVLTGVRGVGKTTTARIIAKGLNCIGPDGSGGPTVTPCGVCEPCRAITEDRHVDVMEMDAASRTGVDDIREIIDGVRYKPVSARYKVYIIDEVHMLSRNAFNALLKTLEEPPEHVKFIFATTEIRKVPITVLSRCQRFDLRRFDVSELMELFGTICGKEGVEADEEALALISRAADGSARDGLSILDQAMALSDGRIAAAQVQEMLGLADRALIFDLFEKVMGGKCAEALGDVRSMYASGADPVVMLQDLLDLTHLITRLKTARESALEGASELERTRGVEFSDKLSLPVLARTWQMLMKGLGEVQNAPSTLAALEMVLIRLAYTADLPPPGELVKAIKSGKPDAAPTRQPAAAETRVADPRPEPVATMPPPEPASVPSSTPVPEAPLASPHVPEEPAAPEIPETFEGVVALFEEHREAVLHATLSRSVRPVSAARGHLHIILDPGAPETLPGQVASKLKDWTGIPWHVEASDAAPGDEEIATLAERKANAEAAKRKSVSEHPVVAAVLEAFPESTIEAIRPLVREQEEAVREAAVYRDEDSQANEA
ncbi:DNA polymerase III subunit gamma/tau [Nisaea acidiphila]|uniref:DNA polymerase III subunit gamma/tau n=1 Tax=Nisaea acidiphila TaxID=1862145 RepID=A0A9J7AS57_9PROT|nr:DNA polymerase III subunit gamma/tau [Nisaea acidiphila]UUX48149.1 DNA polymerase III subunit gamma/tau [Nisaea acidiphila]